MPEIEVLPLPSTFDSVTTQDNYWESSVALMTTSSRGTVTLQSDDMSDSPIVNPAWLTTREDQELAVAALKRARQFGNAIASISTEEFTPGVSVQSDAQV